MDPITILSYVVCGFLAALAGVVLVGYLRYADQEIGIGYDLDSIAAVAVGGAVLGGGRGRVSGTVAGVLLMAVLLISCFCWVLRWSTGSWYGDLSSWRGVRRARASRRCGL